MPCICTILYSGGVKENGFRAGSGLHAARKMAVGAQDVDTSRLLDALPYYDQGYEASGTQEVVRFVVNGQILSTFMRRNHIIIQQSHEWK